MYGFRLLIIFVVQINIRLINNKPYYWWLNIRKVSHCNIRLINNWEPQIKPDLWKINPFTNCMFKYKIPLFMTIFVKKILIRKNHSINITVLSLKSRLWLWWITLRCSRSPDTDIKNAIDGARELVYEFINSRLLVIKSKNDNVNTEEKMSD